MESNCHSEKEVCLWALKRIEELQHFGSVVYNCKLTETKYHCSKSENVLWQLRRTEPPSNAMKILDSSATWKMPHAALAWKRVSQQSCQSRAIAPGPANLPDCETNTRSSAGAMQMTTANVVSTTMEQQRAR